MSSHAVATCRNASISLRQRITSAAPRFPGTKRCHHCHDAHCMVADLLLHMWRVKLLKQRHCTFWFRQVAGFIPYSTEAHSMAMLVSCQALCMILTSSPVPVALQSHFGEHPKERRRRRLQAPYPDSVPAVQTDPGADGIAIGLDGHVYSDTAIMEAVAQVGQLGPLNPRVAVCHFPPQDRSQWQACADFPYFGQSSVWELAIQQACCLYDAHNLHSTELSLSLTSHHLSVPA